MYDQLPAGKPRILVSDWIASSVDYTTSSNCLKGVGVALYCCDAVNNATNGLVKLAGCTVEVPERTLPLC